MTVVSRVVELRKPALNTLGEMGRGQTICTACSRRFVARALLPSTFFLVMSRSVSAVKPRPIQVRPHSLSWYSRSRSAERRARAVTNTARKPYPCALSVRPLAKLRARPVGLSPEEVAFS